MNRRDLLRVISTATAAVSVAPAAAALELDEPDLDRLSAPTLGRPGKAGVADLTALNVGSGRV